MVSSVDLGDSPLFGRFSLFVIIVFFVLGGGGGGGGGGGESLLSCGLYSKVHRTLRERLLERLGFKGCLGLGTKLQRLVLGLEGRGYMGIRALSFGCFGVLFAIHIAELASTSLGTSGSSCLGFRVFFVQAF